MCMDAAFLHVEHVLLVICEVQSACVPNTVSVL